jgi:hypothetical protein
MSTPEAALTAESNAPNIQSTAEAVLAEAQSLVEGVSSEEATTATDNSAEEAENASGDVEIEDSGDDGATRKRNLSWNDAIKQVPPDIAKLMKQMQGDYTRKTQELASERKNFLAERSALMKGGDNLQERELPEYDPFNEDSMKARIENEVARRLKEVLEPMRQEYQVKQAEDSYQSFLTDHPEFKTDTALRSEVQHLLENNSSLGLETAYWAAKGKLSKAKAASEKQKTAAKRKARKEAAMKGTGKSRKLTGGSSPDRQRMRSMSSADILELAKSMHRNN